MNHLREKGTPVMISGKQRDDLVKYFDALKEFNVMVKGKVYSKKEAKANDYLPEGELGLPIASAEPQVLINKASRAQQSKNSTQSEECVCPGCGGDPNDPEGNHFQSDNTCDSHEHHTGQTHWMCNPDDTCPPNDDDGDGVPDDDDSYDDSWGNNN
jgi:hypothetical protein